jgi:hypothetical protein
MRAVLRVTALRANKGSPVSPPFNLIRRSADKPRASLAYRSVDFVRSRTVPRYVCET